MRIVKEAEERREEIITEAVKLFAQKGFRNTSVNDILAAVNIAKGTFYYHFKSKEELLDMAIYSYTEKLCGKLSAVERDGTLNAVEKFIRVIADASDGGDEFKRQIIVAVHQPGNELLHEKGLILSVLSLVPLLTRIVEEGNRQGLFHAEYPQTTVEVLMIASQFMFDERFFAGDEKENKKRLREFLCVTENMLKIEKGTFDVLVEKLSEEVL